MPTLSDVLSTGNTTNGNDVVVSSGDSVTLEENSSVPGGSPSAGEGKLWVRDDAPNTLRFTDDTGSTAHLGLYSSVALSVRDHGATGDGLTDDTTAIQNALNAAASGSIKTVVFPPGTYNVSDTIDHPAGVVVRGAGVSTIIAQTSSASPVWDFADGIVRGELSELVILGQAGETVANRVGTGLMLSESTFVTVRHVQIWDFAIGIDLSDGTPYSAYNVIGPRVEVNRCTTGVRALANCNDTLMFGSRVFWAFGAEDEGIGIDIEDAGGLTLLSNAIESADLCLRIRSETTGQLQTLVAANYLEPGTNSYTSTVGSAYDIVVEGSSGTSDANVVQGFANTVSANRAFADLRPSTLHYWDGTSSAPFGAKYAGTAVPRRNLIRNGGLGYFSTSLIPDWSTAGSPTLAEETTTVATGVRSLRVTATATTSRVISTFVVSDPTVEWITVGVRYMVVSQAGFSVTALSGSNLAQRPDPQTSGGEWQEMQITVRRDPTSTVGQVIISPDIATGSGQCLVDEVWAVAGRYAVDSTQYGERIELLPAPITIASATGLTSNSTWGPVDITTLPSTLSAPLDDFSTAPLGVCGGLYRLRLEVEDGSGSGLLSTHNWIYIDVPAAGSIVSATVNRVTAVYANNPVEGIFPVRTTNPSGGVNRGSGALDYGYEVALVGWILR